eukprot:UN13792
MSLDNFHQSAFFSCSKFPLESKFSSR